MDSRTASIEQLIPAGSICPCCERLVQDHKHWRLTIFGDVLCKECRKQDEVAHPDLYADPVLRYRAAQHLTKQLQQDLVLNLRLEQRSHRSTPPLPQNLRCPACKQKRGNNRHDWVWTDVLGDSMFICKSCYYCGHFNVVADHYREDRWHRVFMPVADDKGNLTLARYPFGIQRINPGSRISSICCQTIYDLQAAEMFDIVQQYMDDFERLLSTMLKKLHREHTHPYFYDDEVRDVAFISFMRAATLTQHGREFLPYMTTAIKRSLVKEIRKRRRAYFLERAATVDVNKYQDILVDSHFSVETLESIDSVLSCMDEHFDLRRFFTECEKLIGPENWEIFLLWVLNGRTQKQIGEDLGILSQSVGMRLKRVIQRCRTQIQPPMAYLS